jgi:nucleoside-diphosphate-sugar epimerase
VTRVIVTGAAGFIGANVARRLLADGLEPFLLTLPSSDPWRLADLNGDARLVQVDLVDQAAVARVVADIKPDWVLHLAAHGGYSWQTDAGAILRANVVGTANLLAACRRSGVETFVNTGSSSEYGLKDHPPGEEEPVEPNSIYAAAKAAATMLCEQAAMSDGMNVSTLRLYSTYGPWEDPNRLIPALAVEGLRGEFPPLVAPETARDFVWIGDVVDAYLLAARTRHSEPGAIYNVGTGVQTTVGEAADIARDVLGIDARPTWGSMPARTWDTDRWVADNTKIRDRLGWRATCSLREGFTELSSWLRERPDVLSRYWSSRG